MGGWRSRKFIIFFGNYLTSVWLVTSERWKRCQCLYLMSQRQSLGIPLNRMYNDHVPKIQCPTISQQYPTNIPYIIFLWGLSGSSLLFVKWIIKRGGYRSVTDVKLRRFKLRLKKVVVFQHNKTDSTCYEIDIRTRQKGYWYSIWASNPDVPHNNINCLHYAEPKRVVL